MIIFVLFHGLSITFVDTLPIALDDDLAKESITEDYNATMAENADAVNTYQESVYFTWVMMMMIIPVIIVGAFWMKGEALAKFGIGVGLTVAITGTLFSYSGALFGDGFDFVFMLVHIVLATPMVVGGYLWLQDNESSDVPTEA